MIRLLAHIGSLLYQLRASDGTKSDSFCVTSSSSVSGTGYCNNGDIFLKGQYVQVGMNNAGSFGTNKSAPSSYIYSGKKLGFIADFDKNGFSSSSKPSFAGDYFDPGIPLEGLNYYMLSLFFLLFNRLDCSVGFILRQHNYSCQ